MVGAALTIRTDLASPARLRALARRERNPRTATRMLAIASALEGKSRAEAARLAGMERQALRDAVVRYNAEGLEGLRDRPKPGRRPALSEPEQALLLATIFSGPDRARYGCIDWTLPALCYKYVKSELGWADFQVRGDTAIRRHWLLVCAAFSFCWWQAAREGHLAAPPPVRPGSTAARAGRAGAGKKYPPETLPLLAEGAASSASLVGTFPLADALLDGLGAGAATTRTRHPA